MTIPQRLFNICWIPFCALAMLTQTRVLLNIPPSFGWLDGFVFGATVFGYHFNHTHGYYRLGVSFAGFLGGICFLLAAFAAPDAVALGITVAVPLLFWWAYYGLTRTGETGLRALPLAKPVIIALTWAWVTVLLPMPVDRWSELIFMFFGRASFLFVLALGYDLVDTDYDRLHGLTTLTGTLGVDGSFVLIYSSLAFSGACFLANFNAGVFSFTVLLALLFSLGFTAVWLPFLIRERAWERWQKVLIDGVMVLQCVLVVLSR